MLHVDEIDVNVAACRRFDAVVGRFYGSGRAGEILAIALQIPRDQADEFAGHGEKVVRAVPSRAQLLVKGARQDPGGYRSVRGHGRGVFDLTLFRHGAPRRIRCRSMQSSCRCHSSAGFPRGHGPGIARAPDGFVVRGSRRDDFVGCARGPWGDARERRGEQVPRMGTIRAPPSSTTPRPRERSSLSPRAWRST